MNILITGVNGFIGQSLVKVIRNSNYNLIGIDKLDSIYSDKNRIKYKKCDLLDKERVNELCDGVDVIVHLAGEADLEQSQKEYLQNNILASKNLVESAIVNKVKKIIFLSSIKINENERDNKNKYIYSKKSVETIIVSKTQSTNTTYTIIRSASVYGYGMKSNIAKWVWAIKRSAIPKMPESQSIVTMIGIDDLCRCIVDCVSNEKTENKIYALTDNNSYKINEIEKVARNIFDKNNKIITCPKWILFISAKFGDFLAIFKIHFPLNSRIYNLLFNNTSRIESEYHKEVGSIVNQNFLREISHIFTDNKKI